MDVFLNKLGFLLTGILILVSLVLLVFLVFAAGNIISDGSLQGKGDGRHSDAMAAQVLDGPNVVADSIAATANGFGKVMSPVGNAIGGAFGATVTAVANTGKFIGNSIYTGVTFAVRGIATGMLFVFHIPSNILGLVTNTSASALIQPDKDIEVPVIKSYPATTLAAHTAAPTLGVASSTPHQAGAASAWPLQGRVTTLFGVPHWPWQPTHTGLDISSGRASGITPIKPFEPGRVIDVVHSAYGLGNHVVVDHGGGITSVYAHLHSTAVKVGQTVDRHTILGQEGSTGASTGTHLHFEIRINGQPINPQQHIHGHP